MRRKALLPEDLQLAEGTVVLPVPRADSPPALSSRPESRGWLSAARISDWQTHLDRLTASTTALLLWDQARLYVMFRCAEPTPDRLRFGQTRGLRRRRRMPILNMLYHRPRFCEDDTVEVFIDASNEALGYHHLLLNPAGDVFSSRGWASRTRLEGDYQWRCAGLGSHAEVGGDGWSGALAIPFARLGLEAVTPGQMLGLNLRRERNASQGSGEDPGGPLDDALDDSTAITGEGLETYWWQKETLAWSTQISTTLVYQPEMFNKIILGTYAENVRHVCNRIRCDYAATGAVAEELQAIAARRPGTRGQWDDCRAALGRVLERLYAAVSPCAWWVRSTPPQADELLPGLIDRPCRPAPGEHPPAALAPVALPPVGNGVSLWATNLAASARTPDIQLTHPAGSIGPCEGSSVRSGETLRLDYRAGPGDYQLRIEGAVGPTLQVVRTAARGIAGPPRFEPPEPCRVNGRDFWELYAPVWDVPGVPREQVQFLEDSGLFLSVSRLYRAALRKIAVYEPAGEQDLAQLATATASPAFSRLGATPVPTADRPLLSRPERTPVGAWIVLDFGRIVRIGRVVIGHGEACQGTINGYPVQFLNVADRFELQYSHADGWRTIRGTRIAGNRKPETTHRAGAILTRRLRLCIHSQCYSGIDYADADAWKWFFEGAPEPLAGVSPRGAERLARLERHLAAAPFTLQLYRFSRGDEVAAASDPDFPRALDALLRRFPETFHGFWLPEWESDQLNVLHGLTEAARWQDLASFVPAIPRGRHQALALLKKWFLLEQSMHHGWGFGMNCYRCGDHWHLAWGSRAAWIETTQSGNPSHRVQFAFQRGAARQFGKPMGMYSAVYLGPGRPCYTRPVRARVDLTPEAGTSPSLYWRTIVYGWLSGVNLMTHESQFSAHLIPAENSTYALSPHGAVLERFCELRKRVPERGVPYTPVAVVLPFEHGWYPAFMTGRSTGVAGGRVVGNGEVYGPADEMVDAFFRTVFGWVTQRRERPGHPFAHTAFGDWFDVLVVDPPDGLVPPATLRRYPVLILLGPHQLRPAVVELLSGYARHGGTLVLDAVSAKAFAEHPNLMVVPHPWFGAGAGAMASGARAALLEVCRQVMPVHVVGDIHHCVNQTVSGWLVALFNHRGVYKMPKERAVLVPAESARAHIAWHGRYRVHELVENREMGVASTGVEVVVPPGEVRIVHLSGSAAAARARN